MRLALALIYILALAAETGGCIPVPLRLPRETRTPSGDSSAPDASFIRIGETQREEVEQKLAMADVHLSLPQASLFRWVSTSGGILAVGMGAAYQPLWGEHNLLVEYDDQGIVSRLRSPSASELVPVLQAWLWEAGLRPLDSSTPIELRVRHWHSLTTEYTEARLILGHDSIEFIEEATPKHSFRVARSALREVRRSKTLSGQEPDAAFVRQALHFARPTAAGRKVVLGIDLPDLVTLLRYLPPPARKSASASPRR